jgi:hypothetical protein
MRHSGGFGINTPGIPGANLGKNCQNILTLILAAKKFKKRTSPGGIKFTYINFYFQGEGVREWTQRMINFTQQFNVLEVIFANKPPGLGLTQVLPSYVLLGSGM